MKARRTALRIGKIAQQATGRNIAAQFMPEVPEFRYISKAMPAQRLGEMRLGWRKQSLCHFGALLTKPLAGVLDQQVLNLGLQRSEHGLRRPHKAACPRDGHA